MKARLNRHTHTNGRHPAGCAKTFQTGAAGLSIALQLNFHPDNFPKMLVFRQVFSYNNNISTSRNMNQCPKDPENKGGASKGRHPYLQTFSSYFVIY
jgi:hypothetical protein